MLLCMQPNNQKRKQELKQKNLTINKVGNPERPFFLSSSFPLSLFPFSFTDPVLLHRHILVKSSQINLPPLLFSIQLFLALALVFFLPSFLPASSVNDFYKTQVNDCEVDALTSVSDILILELCLVRKAGLFTR